MLVLHAGRFRLSGGIRRNNSRIHADFLAENLLQHLLCDISRAQDHRRLLTQINDRRLDPDADRPSVQNHRYSAVHIKRHVGRLGRARLAGCVSAWCCNQASAPLDQPERYRMLRHTDCHGIHPARGLIRDSVIFPYDHGKRSRPERVRKLLRLRRYLPRDRYQIFKL